MRLSSSFSVPLAVLVALGIGACDRSQSQADAAAIASAREAQLKAEARLEAMKELAAKAPQPVPEPAATPVTPAAAEPAPAANNAPAPATGPATVSLEAASCGCTAPTCACTTVTVSLTPSARKPGNVDWDPMGGAPDPQVTLRTPLVSRKSTVFKDQLAVTIPFTRIPLSPGDAVAIDAFDADAAVADPMGTFQTSYPGGSSTKSGSMAAATVTVNFAK